MEEVRTVATLDNPYLCVPAQESRRPPRPMLVAAAVLGVFLLGDVATNPAWGAGLADEAKSEATGGFQPLFNGKNLAGWTVPIGNGASWTVRNGVIQVVPIAGGTALATARSDYTDFHLKVELYAKDYGVTLVFRPTDSPDNVRFYSFGTGTARPDGTIIPLGAYTFKAGGVGPKSFTQEGLRALTTPELSPLTKNTWHLVEIIAVGNVFKMKVDGRDVSGFSDTQSRLKQGRIEIRVANGRGADIRKIEIKELKASTPVAGATGATGAVTSSATPLSVNVPAPPVDAIDALPGDFVPLFNARNFDGWKSPGEVLKRWEVRNGAISAITNGRISTEREDYGDFHLRAQLKAGEQCSGNLFFRSMPTPGPGRPNTYSVRIVTIPPAGQGSTVQDHAAEARTGSLTVSTHEPPSDQRIRIVETDLIRPNEWFTLELIAVGNHFVLRLNGKEVLQADDPDQTYKRGSIGLQRGPAKVGGELFCRKIEIKELNKGGSIAATNPASSPQWLLPAGFPVPGQAATWSFTIANPGPSWMTTDFDERTWSRGQAPFGTRGKWSKARWESPDIWLRSRVDVPGLKPEDQLYLYVRHDDDVTVLVNGKPLYRSIGSLAFYSGFPLSAAQRALFHPGRNTIAVRCHNAGAEQGIDVGLRLVRPSGTQGSTALPAPAPLTGKPGETLLPPGVSDEPAGITNTLGMKLVLLPAGEFLMGSRNAEQDAESDERPRHLVRITRPFYLGVYELTQGQYRTVTAANPSSFKGPDDLPVEMVSWFDAVAFCNALSVKEQLKPYYVIKGTGDSRVVTIADGSGDGYRLPTESEWEYACRAGSTAKYSFGDDPARLGEYAWLGGKTDPRTLAVGLRSPNAFGLNDMHGNVWEWCWDRYDEHYYERSPDADPAGASASKGSVVVRVCRGGGWGTNPTGVRAASRKGERPGARNQYMGFRVARGRTGA